MGIILDTSILIEAERGKFDIKGFINGREEEPFGLSVITVAELLHGVHRAGSEKRRLNPHYPSCGKLALLLPALTSP